jgi:hypothetical protein
MPRPREVSFAPHTALQNNEPLGSEFVGRNTWKLQSDLRCFPHKRLTEVIFSKATGTPFGLLLYRLLSSPGGPDFRV